VVQWDPEQYVRFADERGRPFHDLIARVGATAPRLIVDLGCGPGALTATLAQRWPAAQVEGLDASAEMIEAASPLAGPRLRFRQGTAEDWRPPSELDLLVSNATLQWVPSHRELLVGWAEALRPDGWLAFQVPANFDAPSHTLMRQLAESDRWRPRLGGVLRHTDAVAAPESYARLLLAAGLIPDAWQTTYLHLLRGADPVLQWVRGTGLRPVLQALAPDEAGEFEADYAAMLREAYPAGDGGTTIMAFTRTFVVAHRPPRPRR